MSNTSDKVKFFIRMLFGKYQANDYIMLGRFISSSRRGGADLPEKSLRK